MKKFLKAFLSVLSCVCLVISVMAVFTVTADTTASYVKVTEAPADWSGDYLIVYEASPTSARVLNGALTTLDATGNHITATITDGVIEANATTNAAKFTIAKSGSNYTIKTAGGKYIGNSGSSSNRLQSTTTATTYTNVLTLESNGTVTVKAGDGGSFLRFNNMEGTSNNRFRYYKSSSYTSQQAICLYKYVETAAETTTTTEATTTTTTQAAPAGETVADGNIVYTYDEEWNLHMNNCYDIAGQTAWDGFGSEALLNQTIDFAGKNIYLVYDFTLATGTINIGIRRDGGDSIVLSDLIGAKDVAGWTNGSNLPLGTYKGVVEVNAMDDLNDTFSWVTFYGDKGWKDGLTHNAFKLVNVIDITDNTPTTTTTTEATTTTTEATTTTTTTTPATLTPVEIIDAVFAGGTMEDVTLTGKVVSIDQAYSEQHGNITVSITVEGREDKALKCYRLSGTDVQQIAVGDTITVEGDIVQYNDKPQFAQGAKMTNRVSGGATAPQAPDDQKEIVDALYALEEGGQLAYEGTLTGTVTEITEAYSEKYGNITVIITVEGRETKPVTVYRMKGTGAEALEVGDVITVTGGFKNHYGIYEMINGQLSKVEAGTTTTEATTTTTTAPEADESDLIISAGFGLIGTISNTDESATLARPDAATGAFVLEGMSGWNACIAYLTGDASSLQAAAGEDLYIVYDITVPENSTLQITLNGWDNHIGSLIAGDAVQPNDKGDKVIIPAGTYKGYALVTEDMIGDMGRVGVSGTGVTVRELRLVSAKAPAVETTTTTAPAGEDVPAGDAAPIAIAGLAVLSAAALIVVTRKEN